MIHRSIAVALIVLTMSSATAACPTLLKAIYTPVAGSDREYGQGAIERNELAHREIVANVWLVRVPDDDGPGAWEHRLNECVDPKHGAFRVIEASEEEKRRVESGEITLQK